MIIATTRKISGVSK